MSGVTRVRRDDDDPVAVVKVDDSVASRTAPRPLRLEQRGGEEQRRGEAAPREPQEQRVEFPVDVAGDETREAGSGERGLGLGARAKRMGRIDVPELDGHATAPLLDSPYEMGHSR